MSDFNDIEEIPEDTFPINLRLIQTHQREEPSTTVKYKDGRYHKGYVRGGINIYLNLITCKYKIVIMSKLQSYVVHWYHTYQFHPGMDITEVMITQHLYWPDIIDVVRK